MKSTSNYKYIELAESRVKIGDLRTDALAAMSDAWYHSDCLSTYNMIEDVFYYGPRTYDEVHLVIIRSEKSSNEFRVSMIGSLESQVYMGGSLGECIPPELREEWYKRRSFSSTRMTRI